MIKHYCDVCGELVTPETDGRRLVINHGKGKHIIVGHITMELENEPEGYDLCKYCVFDVIAKYDDRPKEVKG